MKFIFNIIITLTFSLHSINGGYSPPTEIIDNFLNSALMMENEFLSDGPPLGEIINLVNMNDESHSFLLEHHIGEGGQGSVYLGYYDSDPVAIKFMANLGEAAEEAYYLYELKQNENEKVLTIFCHIKTSQNEEGPAFLVTERVDYGFFSIPFTPTIAYDLLRGLSYIHESGFVHNDIKPDNIMFREEKGNCVYIDFGVSDVLEFAEENKKPGTPLYCSRDGQKINGVARDLLGLGMALAELNFQLSLSEFRKKVGYLRAEQFIEENEEDVWENPSEIFDSQYSSPSQIKILEILKKRNNKEKFFKKAIGYKAQELGSLYLSDANAIMDYIDHKIDKNEMDLIIYNLIAGNFNFTQEAIEAINLVIDQEHIYF